MLKNFVEMGNFYQSLVFDILRMLQLPCNVEWDVDGPSTDVERRGDIALKRVAHHKQLMGQDVEMLAELLELSLGLIGCYLYVREILAKAAAMELVLLVLKFALGEHHQTVGIGLQALQGRLNLGQGCGRQMQQRLAVCQQL